MSLSVSVFFIRDWVDIELTSTMLFSLRCSTPSSPFPEAPQQ